MNDWFKSIWLYINLTLYGFNKFIFLLGLFDTHVTCRAYPNFKTMIKNKYALSLENKTRQRWNKLQSLTNLPIIFLHFAYLDDVDNTVMLIGKRCRGLYYFGKYYWNVGLAVKALLYFCKDENTSLIPIKCIYWEGQPRISNETSLTH